MDLVVLHGDPPVAFMECWTGVWPITITKHEGWMGAAPLEQDSTLRKLFRSRVKPLELNGPIPPSRQATAYRLGLRGRWQP